MATGGASLQGYRVEVILGMVFLALFLAYSYFASAGPKLTREEVAGMEGSFEFSVRWPGLRIFR
jgi:hypothetical protein